MSKYRFTEFNLWKYSELCMLFSNRTTALNFWDIWTPLGISQKNDSQRKFCKQLQGT